MRKVITAVLLGMTMIGGTAAPALADDGWRDRREARYDRREQRLEDRYDRRRERLEARREQDRYYGRRVADVRNSRYYDDYRRCKKDSDLEGTAIGGVAGGVLGNVIAPSGDKTLGTVIGAALGGVLGNRIDHGDGNRRC